MSEHSTPWSISEARTVDGSFMVVGGEGASFGLIADVTTEELAKFIVKAGNGHDALVKALRPFIEALPGYEHAKLIDKRYGEFNPIQATVTKAQMQAAREALAKATGT